MVAMARASRNTGPRRPGAEEQPRAGLLAEEQPGAGVLYTLASNIEWRMSVGLQDAERLQAFHVLADGLDRFIVDGFWARAAQIQLDDARAVARHMRESVRSQTRSEKVELRERRARIQPSYQSRSAHDRRLL